MNRYEITYITSDTLPGAFRIDVLEAPNEIEAINLVLRKQYLAGCTTCGIAKIKLLPPVSAK